MKTAIHSYNGEYEVALIDNFKERSVKFIIKYLGEERSLALALELDEKLKDRAVKDFDTANNIIDEYVRIRDHEYIDHGMGITFNPSRREHVATFNYNDSDHMFRMPFSEMLLGKTVAEKITKKFLKEIYDVKNNPICNENDIDLIIEKYCLYKAKQQINRDKWRRHKIIGKL